MAPPEIMSQLVALAAVSRQAFGVARHGYLNLSLDGNQWCVLFGSNLHDGVAGFGNTFNEAVAAFQAQFETANDRPPIPTTGWDWSAWIDGSEDGKVGRGATEDHAMRDLLQQIEDA
jgi:hypothetical protein